MLAQFLDLPRVLARLYCGHFDLAHAKVRPLKTVDFATGEMRNGGDQSPNVCSVRWSAGEPASVLGVELSAP